VTEEPLSNATRDDTTLSSVRNAARLLAAFTATDRELGVTDLARRVGLAKSTVHRLLTTLVREGLIERGAARGQYRLGLRLYELGAMAPQRTDLHVVAVGPMDELRARTGETVHVAVLDGTDVVAVDRRETPGMLRLASRLGVRHPAHATSAGKVLLAYLPLAERTALLDGHGLAALTTHTITDRARLEEELAKVRSRGWAECAHEHEIGLVSVASPVRDGRGRVVAAVGIAGPASRLGKEAVRRFALETTRTADAISAALGYRAREPAARAGR
jgi:IclR family transcriptional regulator, KDG regulon repressor